MCTFQQGRDLLQSWRDVTACEYPDADELLELIPKPEALCVSRLANSAYLMTDTCITEQLFKTKFVEMIQQIAKEKDMNQDDIKVYIGDYWQHFHGVCTGAVVKDLCSQLLEDLKDDLDDLHFTLQVQTEVGQIYRSVEKEFAETAQYAKGDSTMFYGWKETHHPTTYIYPCARVLGGARQDLGSEGAIPVLMNIPYYLEFLNWKLCCRSDNICMKNLYIMLQLVEVVALLH
eukprot:14713782-Ditylum_brightwellii.AAC.1